MISDLRVCLAYTDSELAHYYSPAALDLLSEHATVVRNDTGTVLAGAALARAADGCDVVIAHRSVAVDATALAAMPHLLAVIRGAIDIRTIDIASASAHGVLVTRTTRGFGRAVAELGLGLMFDLARSISRPDRGYRTATPSFRDGRARCWAPRWASSVMGISRNISPK